MICKRLIVLVPLFFALVVVQTSCAQAPVKRFITPDGKRPSGLFAPGVMVGKTLYIAGKGDYRPNDEFPGKVKNCLAEIEKTLKQAGLGFEHVVKSFVYLEDHDKYDDLNKYYGEFFQSNPPARTTLGVAQVPGDSRLEITCIAYADLAERKVIGQPPGRPYSPAILAGDTLYISGKGDQLPDGSHPATFEEQVRQCMRNVEASLKEAGLDFRHVVMNRIFLDDNSNRSTVVRICSEFAGFQIDTQPAQEITLVDWIPGGSHIEITCIATTDLQRRKVVQLIQQGPGMRARSLLHGVWAGDTLYLSGMMGVRETRLPDALDQQVHHIGQNQTDLLAHAGLSLEDIVSGHVYLAQMDDYQGMNAIYKEYFSKGPGVRTTLMPTTKQWSNSPNINPRVMASFIAAKTEPVKP